MKRTFIFIFYIVITIGIAYPQSHSYFEANISSFGNYDMRGKTFYVLSGNSSISNKDLEFLYYKDIITQILIRKQAVPTNNHDSADVCILMDYGITDKSYVATNSTPIWGISGITLSAQATTIGLGYITSSSLHFTNLHFGIIGSNIKSTKVPEYRHAINLYAYDNKDRSREPIMLWKTNLSSDIASEDISSYFPYLAEMSKSFIGVNSHGLKHCNINTMSIEPPMMALKYYISNNVCIFEHPIIEKTQQYVWIHSIVLNEQSTTINLIARAKKDIFESLKFKTNTYIIYNGNKYPLAIVYPPLFKKHINYIKKKIVLDYDIDNWIQLIFPIQMQKGDTFDIVSYFNKKETQEYIVYEKVMVQ